MGQTYCAPSGLFLFRGFGSQGVALGYNITPFQGLSCENRFLTPYLPIPSYLHIPKMLIFGFLTHPRVARRSAPNASPYGQSAHATTGEEAVILIFLSALSALSAVSHLALGGTEALRPPRTLEVVFHAATANLSCEVLRSLPFEIHCVRWEGD